MTGDMEGRMVAATLTPAQVKMMRGVLGFVYARQGPFAAEAAACLALLPEPVDPDEAEAEAIWRSIGYASLNEASDIRKVAVACLKRGRALAAGDAG